MSPQENMAIIKLDEADELGDIATAIGNTCSVLMTLSELETQIRLPHYRRRHHAPELYLHQWWRAMAKGSF